MQSGASARFLELVEERGSGSSSDFLLLSSLALRRRLLDNLALFHRFSRYGQELFVGYNDWRIAILLPGLPSAALGFRIVHVSLFELRRSFPRMSI